MFVEPPKHFSGDLNSRVKLQDQIRCLPKCPLRSKILGAKIISHRKAPGLLWEKREAEKKYVRGGKIERPKRKKRENDLGY